MRTLVKRDARSRVEIIPELRPWREVGWIFRDGDVLAIERRGDHTRVRSAPVHQH
jgi:hypothetical protein